MKLIELINESDKLLHEEVWCLWEMANLYSTETGLNGLVVWVSGGGDKLQHGPRVKVVRGNKFRPELSSTVPLTGVPRLIGNTEMTQDEFAQLVKWINKNRKTILKYWNDEISTKQMVDMIKAV